MIIGNTDSVGVEFELDSNSGGEWMLGRFCLWIDGRRIGDYELGTSLRDVLMQLQPVVGCNGRRDAQGLCDRSSVEVYESLDDLLYGDSDEIPNVLREVEMPGRFEVSLRVDVLAGWKLFLMDCDESSRLLFRFRDEPVIEKRLRMGEFDEVLGRFNSELLKIYDALQTSAR